MADTLFPMPGLRPKILVVAGVVMAVVICWYLWRRDDAPKLVAAPISVSYEQEAMRLTAVVNLQNSSDRPIVASVTNDVFVDSQKQPLTDRQQPQPWRLELASKQANPVTFILQGETAAAVWNGVRLMEVTIDAAYDGRARLNCHFNFMGRFYPQLKQVGIVSNVTSPRQCRRR